MKGQGSFELSLESQKEDWHFAFFLHVSSTDIPYFLDQTPPLNSRRTQIVAASFTYLSFIVAALELSPHILIRAHLPRL